MLARDQILTEYTGNTRGFARAAQYYDRTLARQEQMTHNRLNRIDQRWARSSRAILASTTALGGLGAVLVTAQLRRYAEGWRNVERRLASINVTSEESQQALVDLAVRTRTVVGSTAEAVQRMAKSTKADFETTTRRVETLQKLLAYGGASGSERASVSLQLGQALKSGRLSGDEFRSISENAPVEFLDALANSAGIARSELKEFAQDQRLTTDIVLEALDGLAATADVKFRSLAVSGEEAVDVLTTGLSAYVGRVDESLGATETLNGAMVSLGTYMAQDGEGAEAMANALRVLGSVALATAGSRGIGATTNALKAASAARAEDVAAAQRQITIAQAQQAQSRKTLDSSNAKVRALHAERQARAQLGKSVKRVSGQIVAAELAQQKAATALAGSTHRRTAATNALAAAQARLSVAARITTAAMRGLNSVMAFFGGPIGLALTAITATLAIMSVRTSEVDRLTGAVTERVQQLKAAYVETGGKVDELREKMANASLAQAIADANDLKAKLEEVRGAAKFEVGPRGSLLKLRNAPELDALVKSFLRGEVAVKSFQEQLNEMVRTGDDRLRQLVGAVEEVFAETIKATDAHEKARDIVLALSGTAEEAAAAMARLGVSMEEASVDADNLGTSANAAAQGISGLIAMIPELQEASRLQGKLASAANSRDQALAGLGDRSGWGPGEFNRASEINQLYERATKEIDGTAAATRNASKDLDRYLDNSRISALNAREQALAREGQQYEQIVASLKEAAAGEEALAAARAAHEQNLSSISDRFDKKGGGGGGTNAAVINSSRLSELQEILIEGGQRQLYIEAALNAERANLTKLMPELIALGMSRAEAEKLIAAQLERVKGKLGEVQGAAEEANGEFAKGLLEDIKHAENLEDAIGSIKDRLLDLAQDQAFDLIAEQLSKLDFGIGIGQGDGSGGWLSGIFSSIFGGKRANGGGAQAGKAYLVNEETPRSEIFVPSENGAVLNVQQAQAALRSTSAGATMIAARGSNPAPRVTIYNAPEGQHEVSQTKDGDLEIYLDKKIDGKIQSQVFGPQGQKQMRQTFGLKQVAKGA